MLRGTRIIEDATGFNRIVSICRAIATNHGYTEMIIPSIWEQQPFIEKAGNEILDQMYAFPDKKGRGICLIPEVTAIIQQIWNERWSKEKPKPYRVCYLSRCYRYERPQAGRYREFWQFGCESLGGTEDTSTVLCLMLNAIGVKYEFLPSVKRGLDYYTANGFEAVCESLGAQKQIAGGGSYANGNGFAIGIDRVLMAIEQNK